MMGIISCLNKLINGLNSLLSPDDQVTPFQRNYEYSLTRGFPTPGTKGIFDGNLYSNMFQANESIMLTGVSFFGPAEVEKTHYLVYVEIRQMKGNKIRKFVMEDFWEAAEAQKGYCFRVNFKKPVFLKKNVVYDIRFEIKGPETEYCIDLHNYCKISTYNKDLVCFNFLAKSKQMAEMHFKLA